MQDQHVKKSAYMEAIDSGGKKYFENYN